MKTNREYIDDLSQENESASKKRCFEFIDIPYIGKHVVYNSSSSQLRMIEADFKVYPLALWKNLYNHYLAYNKNASVIPLKFVLTKELNLLLALPGNLQVNGKVSVPGHAHMLSNDVATAACLAAGSIHFNRAKNIIGLDNVSSFDTAETSLELVLHVLLAMDMMFGDIVNLGNSILSKQKLDTIKITSNNKSECFNYNYFRVQNCSNEMITRTHKYKRESIPTEGLSDVIDKFEELLVPGRVTYPRYDFGLAQAQALQLSRGRKAHAVRMLEMPPEDIFSAGQGM